MPHYSLRFLNKQGRMTGRLQFEAASDADAEVIASKVPDARARELWFGSKLLMAWQAQVENEVQRSGRSGRRARTA